MKSRGGESFDGGIEERIQRGRELESTAGLSLNSGG